MWKWKCPVCGRDVEEDFDINCIKNECVGYTHDCPKCGGLVLINEGGICTDFGAVLQRVSNQIDEMEASGELTAEDRDDEKVDCDD